MNKTYIVVVYAHSHYCNWWKKFPVYTKALQCDQKAEIAHLEREVHMMRGKHSEAIQKLKSQFLREKRSYQRESDDKIQEMAQQASQVREPQQVCHSYFKRIFSSFVYQQVGLIWWQIQCCTDRFNQKWSSKNGTKLS